MGTKISVQTDGTRVALGDQGPVNRGGAPRRVVLLEAGTFTPTLLFDGAAVGMAFTSSGHYRRYGDLIFARGNINLTAKGSSTGAATIGGLAVAPTVGGHVGRLVVGGLTGVSGGISALLSSGTAMPIYQSGTGTLAQLTHASFTDSGLIYFSIVYF